MLTYIYGKRCFQEFVREKDVPQTFFGYGMTVLCQGTSLLPDASSFNPVINNNFYNRVNLGQYNNLLIWCRQTLLANIYKTIDDYRAPTGQESRGIQTDGSNTLNT